MNAEVVRQIERLELRDPLENVSAEFPADYYDVHVKHLVEDARRWVAAREQGSNECDTDPKVIAEIRAQLVQNGASNEFMESPNWWGRLKKLLENPGVAGVMYEGGIESRFLAPLLLAMPSSMALEPAFLHGLTVDLKYEEITADDVYFETARREDLFKYIRMRTAFSGDVIKILRPEKSIFYNCGRMFATRFITPLECSQHAICTDIDPTVRAEALFPDSAVRSHYAVLNQPNEIIVEKKFVKDADFAESLGHLIYTFTEDFYSATNDFMVAAISTLKPGGVMVFDLNGAHRDWEKLLLPMAWARGKVTMTFLKDNQTIKDFVKKELLKGAPVEQLISKDIIIRGQDVGVVFAAVRA
ncbi:hypothetical protein IJF85_01125 [Candidatus Saccharibacteria bacterium]|nr:hypothetical protein [Candidatus Saccharibacteria bacterium]MBQ7040568.1 hypothetical protein [Candidatus Saccharibacteria bacterium]